MAAKPHDIFLRHKLTLDKENKKGARRLVGDGSLKPISERLRGVLVELIVDITFPAIFEEVLEWLLC